MLLALVSGTRAADAVDAGLARGDTSEAALRVWEPEFLKAMMRMRRLVCEFYDGLNFGEFVRRHKDKKGLITDILIGNLFKDELDELWPLIDQMKAEQKAAATT